VSKKERGLETFMIFPSGSSGFPLALLSYSVNLFFVDLMSIERHFVGRMSTAPIIISETYLTPTLPVMGQPVSSTSTVRPKLSHQNGKRCALHKLGDTEVDPTILERHEIWMCKTLSAVSSRKEFAPFDKTPLNDRIQLAIEDETLLVYCGDCYQSKHPLFFNLRYVQTDQMKVSEYVPGILRSY
jgi:hypothetical protein